KAHVPQSDAILMKKGDPATLEIAGLESKLTGKVTLVSPALDPGSTTVEIWVQAINRDERVRPGMTAEINITVQTARDAVVIPTAALLDASGDSAHVMVVDSQNQAQSRDVKIGIQSANEAQVVAGLNPGEQVVSRGAYGLPDKTKVKVENSQ